MNDPIADSARGILDGHIILSRHLAAKNHYPAIDLLYSVSRVMTEVVTEEHKKAAQKILQILATYKDAEDLINIGAYVMGSNKDIDLAISKIDSVNAFLHQGIHEKTNYKKTVDELIKIIK